MNGENDPAYSKIVIDNKAVRDARRIAWAQCGNIGQMRTRFETYHTGPFKRDESENGGVHDDVKSMIRRVDTEVTYVFL